MARQTATKKLHRESRRERRNGSRDRNQDRGNDHYPESHGSNISTIGMAKDNIDRRPLKPLNENQDRYIQAIKNCNIILGVGDAGSGKTFISASIAAAQLINKDIERIVVTRPMVSAEEEMGFLPGDVSEKFLPFFRPVYDVLKKRLGASFLQYALKPGIEKVEVLPFSFMRGRSLEDAFVILDEAQNVTATQMKLFLTRMGENVTVVISGDPGQCDLPKGKVSGLADLIDRIYDCDLNIPVIEFDEEDCVRSDICKTALQLYKN